MKQKQHAPAKHIARVDGAHLLAWASRASPHRLAALGPARQALQLALPRCWERLAAPPPVCAREPGDTLIYFWTMQSELDWAGSSSSSKRELETAQERLGQKSRSWTYYETQIAWLGSCHLISAPHLARRATGSSRCGAPAHQPTPRQAAPCCWSCCTQPPQLLLLCTLRKLRTGRLMADLEACMQALRHLRRVAAARAQNLEKDIPPALHVLSCPAQVALQVRCCGASHALHRCCRGTRSDTDAGCHVIASCLPVHAATLST